MKQIYLYLACLLFSLAAHADKGHSSKADKAAVKSGSVQFKFNNLAPAEAHKDSVLIIFDRTNHTGAGVIYKVFFVDENGNIDIEGVPEGKYFVTIQGLGIHRDRTEKVLTVKSQKNSEMSIKMEDSEEFSKANVVIPSSKTDLSALSIVKMK
jgi:hypothetical protein